MVRFRVLGLRFCSHRFLTAQRVLGFGFRLRCLGPWFSQLGQAKRGLSVRLRTTGEVKVKAHVTATPKANASDPCAGAMLISLLSARGLGPPAEKSHNVYRGRGAPCLQPAWKLRLSAPGQRRECQRMQKMALLPTLGSPMLLLLLAVLIFQQVSSLFVVLFKLQTWPSNAQTLETVERLECLKPGFTVFQCCFERAWDVLGGSIASDTTCCSRTKMSRIYAIQVDRVSAVVIRSQKEESRPLGLAVRVNHCRSATSRRLDTRTLKSKPQDSTDCHASAEFRLWVTRLFP